MRAVEADRKQERLRRVGRLVGVDEIDRRLGIPKLPLAPFRRLLAGIRAPSKCGIKAPGEWPLPRTTQMPFSQEDTPVSEGFELVGQRGNSLGQMLVDGGGEQAIGMARWPPGQKGGEVEPGGMLAGEHGGSGGGTDRTGAGGGGEPNSLCRQSIQMRRVVVGPAVAAQIVPAQIVCHQQHDMGRAYGGGSPCGKECWADRQQPENDEPAERHRGAPQATGVPAASLTEGECDRHQTTPCRRVASDRRRQRPPASFSAGPGSPVHH